jgi:hypothetical protein
MSKTSVKGQYPEPYLKHKVMPKEYNSKYYTLSASVLSGGGGIIINSTDYVTTNGNNTITGNNTLSGSTSFSKAPTTTQAINNSSPSTTLVPKSYVDAQITTITSNVAYLNGDNSFGSTNVFNGDVSFDGTIPQCNLDYTDAGPGSLINKGYVDSQDYNLQTQIDSSNDEIATLQDQFKEVSNIASDVAYVNKDNTYSNGVTNTFNGDISFNGVDFYCNQPPHISDSVSYGGLSDNYLASVGFVKEQLSSSSSGVTLNYHNPYNTAAIVLTNVDNGTTTNTLVADSYVFVNTDSNTIYASSINVDSVSTSKITYINNAPTLNSSNIGYQKTIYMDWNSASYKGQNGNIFAYSNGGTYIPLAYNISKHLSDLPNGYYMFIYNFNIVPVSNFNLFMSFCNDKTWDSYPASSEVPPTTEYFNNAYDGSQTWYNNYNVIYIDYASSVSTCGQLIFYSAINPSAGITPCLRCLKVLAFDTLNVSSSYLTIIRIA